MSMYLSNYLSKVIKYDLSPPHLPYISHHFQLIDQLIIADSSVISTLVGSHLSSYF